MNASEKKYAITRLTNIRDKKLQAITARHTTPGFTLTSSQRAVALKKGEFKVNPDMKHVESYTNVRTVIIFNDEKAKKVNNAAIAKETKAIRTAYNRVCDQVMLGDGSKALALIEKFEK